MKTVTARIIRDMAVTERSAWGGVVGKVMDAASRSVPAECVLHVSVSLETPIVQAVELVLDPVMGQLESGDGHATEAV